MHSAQQTYPNTTWQRMSIAAVPQSGFFAYARGMSLAMWLLSQSYGFIFFSDWAVHQELLREGFDIKRYFYFGFAAFLLAQLTHGLSAWISAPFELARTGVGGLLTAFCFLMALLSPTSIIPKFSFIYACATYLSIVMLWLFWKNN